MLASGTPCSKFERLANILQFKFRIVTAKIVAVRIDSKRLNDTAHRQAHAVPFTGHTIGPFHVLSPHKIYPADSPACGDAGGSGEACLVDACTHGLQTEQHVSTTKSPSAVWRATFQSFHPALPTRATCCASCPAWLAIETKSMLRHSSIRNLISPQSSPVSGGCSVPATDRAKAAHGTPPERICRINRTPDEPFRPSGVGKPQGRFGTSAQFWLNPQMMHELEEARQHVRGTA